MRIAITGANGFIGSELVNYFLSTGNEVCLLQRKAPATLHERATYRHYDLNDIKSIPHLTTIDALIHTAYIPTTKNNNSSQINIDGTLALYNLCINNGVQFVFLSSMSAHQNALSEYGKHKFALENILDKNKCLILKLGLVMGKKGLFNRIKSSLSKTSISFLIGGGNQPVQPVYIGDVAKVIEKCIAKKLTGSYYLALPQAYTMKQLFQLIGESAGRKVFLVPVPYWAAEFGINAIELLRLPFPVSKENLLGLKQLQAFDTHPDLEKLGVHLTGLKESISLLS